MADRLAGASGLRRPGRSSPVRSCFVEVSPNPIGQDEHVEKGLAELPSETYVPNELLSRLVGDRMYSVEFVLNDYVQFRFDGTPGAGNPVTLNSYVWPVVEVDARSWRESDLGYADALRRLTPGVVLSTSEATGTGLRVVLDTGSVLIKPNADEVYIEIAEIMGFHDGSWMVWRPGEDIFENLG